MFGRKALALLMVAPLLASCGSSASTAKAGAPASSAPATTSLTVAATPGPTDDASEVPSADSSVADQSPTAEPSEPAPPPKPTDFTATFVDGTVPCPSPDPESGDFCKQVNLTWHSTAQGASFRVYASWTGEGEATCDDESMLAEARPVLDTDVDATSAQLFNQIATGGGAECLWITAVTNAGESDPVAAAGQ